LFVEGNTQIRLMNPPRLTHLAPFLVRKLINLSITKKLGLVILVFVIVIGGLLLISYFGLETLSSVRAYVGGEGLWSKAQKDAIYSLRKYTRSQDERDYQKFLEFLSVPLGDKKARAELEKPHPDLQRVYQGLLEGRNHPDDLKGIATLFRKFRRITYTERAISIWAKGDAYIAELAALGEELHREIASDQLSPNKVDRLLSKIDAVNANLTILEDEFSYTLGEAARWLTGVLLSLMAAAATVFLLVGLCVVLVISRHLIKGLLTLQAGTAKIASGDFRQRIAIDSTDELGHLAIAFNRMTEHLVATDTKRKRAEEVLQASEMKFRSLAHTANDAIISADRRGDIMFWNKGAQALFGYREDEVLGKPLTLLMPARYKGAHRRGLERLQSTGESRVIGNTIELHGLRKDGSEFPLGLSLATWETGEGPFYAAIIRDISARKRAEEALRHAHDELETRVRERTAALSRTNEELELEIAERKRAERLKDEFVSTVSHELRTPLSITKEGISLMLDRVPGALNEKQERILTVAKDSIDRLSRIINNLLDISKLEAGKVDLKRTRVDIAGLMTQVALTFTSKATEKGLALRVNVPEGDLYAYADPDKIVQVLTNLVGNAMKFTTQGAIEITARDKGGDVECLVADTGIGISKEHLPRVFERFQQFRRTVGGGEQGTGLGLAIAKELVELHHGTIRVESELGKGTAFTFTLPSYTAETLMKASVKDGINEAMSKRSEMSLVRVTLVERDALRHPLSSETLQGLLEEMQGVLKKTVRRRGTTVQGPGQLVIILAGCDKANVLKVKARLEQVLNDYLTRKQLADTVTCRCGCATHPDDAGSTEELLEAAEKA
jgi:PAS domain S-box-containing protein